MYLLRMKKVAVYIVLLFIVFTATAQGKYAGTKKAMIGKVFTQAKDLTALKGWEFVEGSLTNSLDDPERIICDVYKKGTTWLVFFSIMEDTASGNYKVMDVAEITGVAKGWSVHGSFCRRNKQEDHYIIAWGKQDPGQYMKTIKKAWRFNPDKRRFEIISIKGIDCENIGC
jgi:hypothetical protein